MVGTVMDRSSILHLLLLSRGKIHYLFVHLTLILIITDQVSSYEVPYNIRIDNGMSGTPIGKLQLSFDNSTDPASPIGILSWRPHEFYSIDHFSVNYNCTLTSVHIEEAKRITNLLYPGVIFVNGVSYREDNCPVYALRYFLNDTMQYCKSKIGSFNSSASMPVKLTGFLPGRHYYMAYEVMAGESTYSSIFNSYSWPIKPLYIPYTLWDAFEIIPTEGENKRLVRLFWMNVPELLEPGLGYSIDNPTQKSLDIKPGELPHLYNFTIDLNTNIFSIYSKNSEGLSVNKTTIKIPAVITNHTSSIYITEIKPKLEKHSYIIKWAREPNIFNVTYTAVILDKSDKVIHIGQYKDSKNITFESQVPAEHALIAFSNRTESTGLIRSRCTSSLYDGNIFNRATSGTGFSASIITDKKKNSVKFDLKTYGCESIHAAITKIYLEYCLISIGEECETDVHLTEKYNPNVPCKLGHPLMNKTLPMSFDPIHMLLENSELGSGYKFRMRFYAVGGEESKFTDFKTAFNTNCNVKTGLWFYFLIVFITVFIIGMMVWSHRKFKEIRWRIKQTKIQLPERLTRPDTGLKLKEKKPTPTYMFMDQVSDHIVTSSSEEETSDNEKFDSCNCKQKKTKERREISKYDSQSVITRLDINSASINECPDIPEQEMHASEEEDDNIATGYVPFRVFTDILDIENLKNDLSDSNS